MLSVAVKHGLGKTHKPDENSGPVSDHDLKIKQKVVDSNEAEP
jgi:hypothetical protein